MTNGFLSSVIVFEALLRIGKEAQRVEVADACANKLGLSGVVLRAGGDGQDVPGLPAPPLLEELPNFDLSQFSVSQKAWLSLLPPFDFSCFWWSLIACSEAIIQSF